jgi:mannosyltransferase
MSTTDTHAAPPVVAERRGAALRQPLILGIVAVIVCLIGSWNVSLWNDEAFTITAASRTPAQLWAMLQQIDAVHGVYYAVMHVWGSIFGFSPVALRVPSALAVGAAVVGVYFIAKALGGARVGVLAGIVAIVLPRITWMGIEGRSYAFSTALAVWASVVLLVALRRGRWFWVLYAGLVAAGTAVSIYVALLVVAHAVTVLFTTGIPWARRLAWLVAAAAGGLVASPVIVTAAGQQGQLGDLSATLASMLRQVVVNQWFLGATPTRVDDSNDGGALWARAALVLAAVCWLLMIWAVIPALRRGHPAERRQALLLVPWMLVPSILVIGYSLAISPLYNPRYFSFTAPAAAVLIALGINRFGRRWIRLGILALIAVIALPIYVSQREVTGKSGTDWSEAAAYIGSHAKSGDGVYFGPLDVPDTPVYSRDTRFVEVAYPGDFTGLTDLTLLTSGSDDNSLRGLSRSIAEQTSALAGVDRVWVVRPVDYPAGAASADDAVLTAAGFTEGARWAGPMTEVVEFSRE